MDAKREALLMPHVDTRSPLERAAPDLLAALEGMVALFDNGSAIIDHSDRRETERDIETARATIAKAKGEA